MTIPVHADFVSDVRSQLLLLLTSQGISVPANLQGDARRVALAYFNVSLKVIFPRRRRVLRSSELQARTVSPQVAAGLAAIESASLIGADLRMYLSERAVRPHTHDWLLNDWGIHHLHVCPPGGDELLYAWVDDDEMLFLDVRGHASMADTDLLEIVRQNWPDRLIPLPGVALATPSVATSSEVDSLRRGGVLSLFTLADGVMYFPRGGGVTTAGGASAMAATSAISLLKNAKRYETIFRQNAENIASMLGVSELHLRFDMTSTRVVETISGKDWLIE